MATTQKDDALVLQTQEVQELETLQKDEINAVFEEAKDFRSIGERITAPLDSIINQTTKIIEKDPILNVSGELEQMNSEMQSVYSEIINNDGVVMKFFKSVPVVGEIAKKLDSTFDAASFNIQDIEGKITTIFSGFDQSYTSLNVSIEMQNSFISGIEENLGGVIAYKNYLAEKIVEFKTQIETTNDTNTKDKYTMFLQNVEFFQSNLVVLIGNLKMAKKRLLIRLDSANKLSLAMNSSKPIFKTLLSSAVIEVSGQKAIDASMKAMEAMGNTIDKMSSTLTDKAIEGNKKAEEMSSKPILSSSVFVENVTKLKNHFDEIETYRAQIAVEAQKEREEFETAENQLASIKKMNQKDMNEFGEMLNQGVV